MTSTAVIVLVLKASVFLIVLSLGLRASLGEIVSVLRAPALLLRSLGAMVVVMPVVAVLLSALLDLSPPVRLALVALSLSPLPPVWPAKSLRRGGEEAYVIGLFVAASVISIVTIPLGLLIFRHLTAASVAIPEGAIVRLVATSVLLPLVIGAIVAWFHPRIAARLTRPVAIAAQVALVAAAVPIVVRTWSRMTSLVGDGTLLAMCLFALLGIGVGHMLAGGTMERRSVLALATAFRHPMIAIVIAGAARPSERAVSAAILLYLLVCAIVTIPYQRWAAARRSHLRPAPR